MDDILEINKFKIFLLFFIPGFISLKVYQLFVASEKIDFSKTIFEVMGYSSFNFAFFFWVLVLIHQNNFYDFHQTWYFIIMGILLFVMPVCWTLLFIWITKHSKLKEFVLNPIKGAWDYYFDSRQAGWVIITLKSGKKVGGVFGNKSFASAYPREEQIYLEQEWVLGANDTFIVKKERTNGIWVHGKEIETIEFYK